MLTHFVKIRLICRNFGRSKEYRNGGSGTRFGSNKEVFSEDVIVTFTLESNLRYGGERGIRLGLNEISMTNCCCKMKCKKLLIWLSTRTFSLFEPKVETEKNPQEFVGKMQN